MNRGDMLDVDARSASSDSLGKRYEVIRERVRTMDADEVARQLPNLVATVAEASTPSENPLQFIIGVSFSQNDTLLDYSLDRLVEVDTRDRPRVETIKPAVSRDHRYLTFPYPPDPHFDAAALRGALLVAIEEQLVGLGGAREWGDREESEENGRPWYVDLWKQFAGCD